MNNITIKEMRKYLLDLDHDCRINTGGCNVCSFILTGSDGEIKNKYNDIQNELEYLGEDHLAGDDLDEYPVESGYSAEDFCPNGDTKT